MHTSSACVQNAYGAPAGRSPGSLPARQQAVGGAAALVLNLEVTILKLHAPPSHMSCGVAHALASAGRCMHR